MIVVKFTVTVCKADSTTFMESDSTLFYDNSDTDSDNDSLLSQPMFVEDTNETEDELPVIKVAGVQGPGPEVAGTAADPDAHPLNAHPVHSLCNKCKAAKNNKDNEVFFFLFILFYSVFKYQIN